ncbi:hypothetical protein Syun_018582 [Stephania yunnanensis]|uniref:Phytocyanin domain-containing protein n=1 Tax=Stephania yunnanensis TaxID=152371 RepID=A0AAP0IT64_9MAGN
MAMATTAALLLAFLLATPMALAVDHKVGDDSGWDQGVNYDNWAKGKTFQVGDNLLFSYGGSHSVDVVSQSDYTSCNTGNAITTYTGGSNTVKLDKEGAMYFVCPAFGHCQGGMKLAVTVSAASTTPSGGSPPSTTTPPSSSSPNGPSSPTTPNSPPSSPTPKPSSASTMNGMMGLVVLGASMAIVGLMG